jgi:hypothetical protein
MHTKHLIVWMGSILACCVCAGSLRGQQLPDPGAQSAPAPQPSVQEQLQELKARIAALERQVQGIDDLQRQLDDLRGRVDALANSVTNTSEIVRDIVTQEGGNYAPNILGKMQTDPRFRDEMQRAVRGKVVFNNYTGVWQEAYINGTLWNVRPGRSYIYVPFGEVRAQLRFFDFEARPFNNWQFDPAENMHTLTINIQ